VNHRMIKQLLPPAEFIPFKVRGKTFGAQGSRSPEEFSYSLWNLSNNEYVFLLHKSYLYIIGIFKVSLNPRSWNASLDSFSTPKD
jgi:hypothetical protein